MTDTVRQGINPTNNDVLIAVMGLTGSGKSAFINLATQSPNKLQVGHSIQSCTDAVERADTFELDGRRIVLFDTPGFDDTNKSEIEILRIIAFELEKQYRKGQTLHGIIYVHRISDLRVGGLAKTNFGIFRGLCGDPFLRNVVIMTNMWSRLSTEMEGHRRVAELASLDDFFKPAMASGAVMMHHAKDTVDSARAVIRQILKNHPIALDIQKEIVDQHKDITQTGAGMALDKKLAELAHRYELRLKAQFEAAEEARHERDEETMKEQLEEAERVRQLLEKLEEEKRDQARQYQLLQERFAKVERKREQVIHEAEERSRPEVRAAEARLRQGSETAERRRAQEKAELDERMKNMAVSSPSYSARVGNERNAGKFKYRTIVSGETYTLYNKKHKLFATLEPDNKYLRMREYYEKDSRQQWVFESDDGDNWSIKSVRTEQYVCLTSRGTLRAQTTSFPTFWRLSKKLRVHHGFRISSNNWDKHDGQVISVGRPISQYEQKGARINLYDELGGNEEIWIIEKP
ncbi:hypothetical protein H1R20_g15031, partial [Candolleomyces eurysporus]